MLEYNQKAQIGQDRIRPSCGALMTGIERNPSIERRALAGCPDHNWKKDLPYEPPCPQIDGFKHKLRRLATECVAARL